MSRRNLGHAETVGELERGLQKCHPTNRTSVAAQLAKARDARGISVFDWLIEIIRDHSNDESESEDNVELYSE